MAAQSSADYWPQRRSESLQDTISAVVQALLAIAGARQDDLAERLGVTASTVSGKMSGRRAWKVSDLEELSRIFDVKPALFFEPPANIFGPALRAQQTSWGGKSSLPRLDSNQQPFAYQTHATAREADVIQLDAHRRARSV